MSSLCLLTVHAHPDDEASKGAGTVSRYHAEGVHTVLVTCTGGEEGDILNPAMDQPGIREHLAEVRRQEDEHVIGGGPEGSGAGERGDVPVLHLRDSGADMQLIELAKRLRVSQALPVNSQETQRAQA